MMDFVKLGSDFQIYFGNLKEAAKGGVDPTTLSLLAKTAANDYLTNKVPLNTSIAKIAQQEKNLNHEHLKRISEMANGEVFEKLFNNSTDKNIHFDLADPDQITDKFSESTKIASYNLSAYSKRPNEKKLREKTASSEISWDPNQLIVNEYGHADPKKDLQEVTEKLNAVKEELLTEKLATKHNMGIAYKDLYKQICDELPDTSFAKIAQAMHSVSEYPEDLNILEDISYDLMKSNKVDFNQVNLSLNKTASMMVNEDHPLISKFLTHIKLANRNRQLDFALQEVEENLSKVANLLRKTKGIRS